jgi:uracil-DNA glycosylase family protein
MTAVETHPPAPVPDRPSLKALREAAATCQACELYANAIQTVFGEGPARARVVLVGEQPGDQEDKQGHPFVGPAGRLLDKALTEAGIDRNEVYVTNAVKHFRNQPRGKRRIHQRPEAVHINACKPWLEAELAVVKPELLVCLGAIAAKALLGSKVRVTKDRGRFIESELAPRVTVTVHPSSILRADNEEDRRAAYAAFVADLRGAAAG